MMWHVLTIGAMVTCAFLAAWQWHRAGSAMGSAINVGYGLQWPLFAIFFGVMWWRMLSMEVRQLRPVDDADGMDGDADGLDDPAAPPVPVARHEGPSPFAPRPASAASLPTAADDPEMAAYNRMLAELAVRDSSS